MANTPQSKKRARQIERRTDINKARRSRIRTFIRKVEEAIASGNADAAKAALQAAQPELMRGVTKGVVHKNTASRKISRLASRVKALSAVSTVNATSRQMKLSPAFRISAPGSSPSSVSTWKPLQTPST